MNRMVHTIGNENNTYNPFIIAKNKDIEIKYIDFGIENYGQLIRIEDSNIILLSQLIKGMKKAFFIVAHELGHYVLKHKNQVSDARVRDEFEANFFATELCFEFYREQHNKKATQPRQLLEYGMPMEMAMFI